MIFGGGSTGGVIGMGMVVHLRDAVGRNADAVMRKIKTLDGVTEVAATRISNSMNRIHAGLGLLAVGGSILAALSFPVKEAIAFESAFTGVRKTVDETEAGFKRLENNFRFISRNAPISAAELSGIGEMAGQLGVKGVDNITHFTDTIAKMAVTTNLTTEAAATQFARISNVMQEPIKNIDRMGSTVVSLGNNFATTEAEIAGFANRMAAGGKIAGLTTDQVFGIATAFSSVGIEAEAGGTAIQQVLLDLNKQGKQGIGAFTGFMTELQNSGEKGAQKLEELGFNSVRLQRAFLSVAGAGGILTDALDNANKAWSENSALSKEAELRFNTTASQLKIMGNNLTDAAITMGGSFLPVVRLMANIVKGLARGLSVIANTAIGKAIMVLVATIATLATVIGVYAVATGAATLASSKLAIAFAAQERTAVSLAFANGGLTGGFYALATAVWAAMAPLLPFIAAGAAIVGVFMLLGKSVKMFKNVMNGSAEPLTGFMGKMQKLGGVIKGGLEIWKSATRDTFSLSSDTHAALEKLGIAELVVNMGTWIARIKALMGGFVAPFKATFKAIGDVVKWVVKQLNTLGDAFGIDLIKNTTNMKNWIVVGKILGGVILTVLVAGFALLAVAVIAATWPFLVFMAAIIGFIAIIKNWGKWMDWLADRFGQTFADIVDFGGQLLLFFATLPIQFMRIGWGIVKAIMAGITNGWDGLVNQLLSLIGKLPGGNILLRMFGVGKGEQTGGGVINTEPGVALNTPTTIGATIAESKTISSSTHKSESHTKETIETVRDIGLYVSGKQVHAAVEKEEKLKNSRE